MGSYFYLTWRSRYEGHWADLGYIDIPIKVQLTLTSSLRARFELVGEGNRITEEELGILRLELSVEELETAYRVECSHLDFVPVNEEHDKQFIESLGACDPVVARKEGGLAFYLRTSLVIYDQGFAFVTLSFSNSITFEYYLNLLHIPAPEFCHLLVVEGSEEYFEGTDEPYKAWYPKISLEDRLA